jgi:phenylacetate-CoA ligase
VRLSGGSPLTIADLDEALFPIEELLDFRATLTCEESRDCLCVELSARDTGDTAIIGRALDALRTILAIGSAELRGDLALRVVLHNPSARSIVSSAKRTIKDKRNQGSVS